MYIRIGGQLNPIVQNRLQNGHIRRFFAANPLSETLSKKPFVINGKWCADNESGFDVPLLKGQMIEVSGNSIFLRERVHNGNSYNAVLLYCLQCNTELDLV